MSQLQNSKTFTVTLIKSVSGRNKKHQACVKGLGLRKIGDSRQVIDTPENRGMVNKANYLLEVEGG